MKRLVAALAVLLGLASCKIDKDPTIVVQEMMNIQSGLLVNDNGVRYSIAGKEGESDILALSRVFLRGTAVPSDVAGYDYSLTPYEWYAVAVQDCVPLSTVSDVDEQLGTSPADLTHVWFHGGYINALVTVSFDSDDEDFDGEINMVFDDTRSTDSNLYFYVKNKQNGKTWEDESVTAEKVVFGSQFFSFPYSGYYSPTFKGEQTINMEWRWFDTVPNTNELPSRTVSVKEGNYKVSVQ